MWTMNHASDSDPKYKIPTTIKYGNPSRKARESSYRGYACRDPIRKYNGVVTYGHRRRGVRTPAVRGVRRVRLGRSSQELTRTVCHLVRRIGWVVGHLELKKIASLVHYKDNLICLEDIDSTSAFPTSLFLL